MAQTDTASMASMTRSSAGAGVWIYRVLLIAGAAFMLYSWFQPWWSTDIAVVKGEKDMILHPWGVEAAAQVRANMDESLFQMPFPQVFAGFMWVYLAVSMLGIAASLFWTKTWSVGRITVSWALTITLLIGLSYMMAVGLAYGIGTLKAAASGINFIGKATWQEPVSHAKLKMVSQLELGYWLSLGAGGFLTLVALARPVFIRKPKA
jgi:hypothetical protein